MVGEGDQKERSFSEERKMSEKGKKKERKELEETDCCVVGRDEQDKKRGNSPRVGRVNIKCKCYRIEY